METIKVAVTVVSDWRAAWAGSASTIGTIEVLELLDAVMPEAELAGAFQAAEGMEVASEAVVDVEVDAAEED